MYAQLEEQKIRVTGNLKYDQKTPILQDLTKKQWQQKMGIFEGDHVITIASTHAPEEKWMIHQIKKLWERDINIKVLLAPRHPERFVFVANILHAENIPFIELSRIAHQKNTEKVILIDTIGFLPICYQLSQLAIIGGSYIQKIGGHNILEPNFYSLPVFFGPYMHAQADLKKLVCRASSGKEVALQDLHSFLEMFLQDTSLQQRMQANAQTLIHSLRGRVLYTFTEISSLFSL